MLCYLTISLIVGIVILTCALEMCNPSPEDTYFYRVTKKIVIALSATLGGILTFTGFFGIMVTIILHFTN